MTILLACGWEGGSSYVWNATVSGAELVGGAHTGNYCLKTWAGYLQFPITGSPSALYIGNWMNMSGGAYGYIRIGTSDSTIEIRVPQTDAITAYVNGVLTATGTHSCAAGWNNIQLYVSFADAGGKITVKYNGYLDIDFTGDTLGGASAAITYIRLGSNVNAYIDDFIVRDDVWPGDIRIVGLQPDGAGDLTEWTPNGAATNWQCVDEYPPGDLDWVEATGENSDLYTLTDWAGAGNTPVCVVQYARAEKLTGDTYYLKLLAKEGGSTNTGASTELVLNTYQYFQRVLETKPSGGSWDDAAVDGLQIGQKLSAT